ncbi:gamma-glutamylcyclotransferase family protein [Pseudonocardia abyssalis]|uniref:Gamma-glutamylcyclotransferase n=2 Tax=Pseudonocardia abyssalis TaxID=2792008 RepID=A0ABS6UWW7_9PSEU|nr:gamma-glutamylcyclotransferase family protein [Pseudonocardia abyssalis]MBW0136734.1 gamma-glutamylcyclotransferase [Pseudonocardia abyssalis]
MPRPDSDFPDTPYPGAVPPTSFAHVDGMSHALTPGPWRIGDVPLDDWLAARGAAPAAERVPVLAYGSNRCPGKISWLRAELGLGDDPVVVLRARTTGVAAVWAAGHRARDGQRPATLAAAPGIEEEHAVWLATPEQVAVLDRCEGRDERFRLARLRTGTVLTEDGARIDGAWVYVGHSPARAPLHVDGRPVRCVVMPQAAARDLVGEPGADGLDAPTVVGPPHPDQWPTELFAYGLLQPGQVSWHYVEPHAAGGHRYATVAGAVLDTGRGYPAWLPDSVGAVPGTLIALRDPIAAFPAMDAYEGPEYRRIRTVTTDGTVGWAYAWRAPTDGFRPGWAPAVS